MREFMRQSDEWQLGYIKASSEMLVFAGALCPNPEREILLPGYIKGYLVSQPKMWNDAPLMVIGTLLQEAWPCEKAVRYK
jgi:hypothetical protein